MADVCKITSFRSFHQNFIFFLLKMVNKPRGRVAAHVYTNPSVHLKTLKVDHYEKNEKRRDEVCEVWCLSTSAVIISYLLAGLATPGLLGTDLYFFFDSAGILKDLALWS